MTTRLTPRVAAAVIARGRASVDDILPLFPQYTRKQIVDALHHAKDSRLISLVAKGRNLGYRKGETPSTYGPYVAPPAVHRVASVWDLGSRFAAQA